MIARRAGAEPGVVELVIPGVDELAPTRGGGGGGGRGELKLEAVSESEWA